MSSVIGWRPARGWACLLPRIRMESLQLTSDPEEDKWWQNDWMKTETRLGLCHREQSFPRNRCASRGRNRWFRQRKKKKSFQMKHSAEEGIVWWCTNANIWSLLGINFLSLPFGFIWKLLSTWVEVEPSLRRTCFCGLECPSYFSEWEHWCALQLTGLRPHQSFLSGGALIGYGSPTTTSGINK